MDYPQKILVSLWFIVIEKHNCILSERIFEHEQNENFFQIIKTVNNVNKRNMIGLREKIIG